MKTNGPSTMRNTTTSAVKSPSPILPQHVNQHSDTQSNSDMLAGLPMSRSQLFQLQRVAGNRAVTQLLDAHSGIVHFEEAESGGNPALPNRIAAGTKNVR